MKPFRVAVATLALTCASSLWTASAFQVVTDSSGFISPARLADDPDGDYTGDTGDTGQSNLNSPAVGGFEYHVRADAFDKSFSLSGYTFEDELLNQPTDDQAKAQPVTVTKQHEAAKKPLAKH